MATTRCPECQKRVRKRARTCPRCKSEIREDQGTPTPKWHERTSVSLCTAALLAVVGLGFIHIIVGVRGPRDLPFDLALRKSFGYRELVVDAGRIRAIPYVAATLKYPLGLRVLQAKGYLPSGPTLETRMVQQMRDAMNRWHAEFEANLGRSERSWQERMQQAPQTAEADPQSAAAFNDRAIASARQGRYDAALAELATAIRKSPVLAEAFYNRALLYTALGNLGQASSDLGKVLEIRPQFADARLQRGRIHVTLEHYDDAIADFSEAIEMDPACADAYLWRSMICFVTGDIEKSLRDIQSLRDLEAPVPDGLLAALQTSTPRPVR